jgi:hypothetical protein
MRQDAASTWDRVEKPARPDDNDAVTPWDGTSIPRFDEKQYREQLASCNFATRSQIVWMNKTAEHGRGVRFCAAFAPAESPAA